MDSPKVSVIVPNNLKVLAIDILNDGASYLIK